MFRSPPLLNGFSSPLPQFAAHDAINHPTILTQIASALNTPHLPTRKLLLDLLCFLEYFNDSQCHNLVVSALEALSATNNEAGNPYAYWFKSLEVALAGRGKMGTLVGASDEVKKHGGIDPSLNDYTVRALRTASLPRQPLHSQS